jgi:hypothetical protein
MNVGIIVLGLMLVTGSVLAIIMIGSQNQTPVTDTFGDVQSTQSNSTMGTITNTTSPLASAGAGIAFVIVLFLLFVAAIFLFSSAKSHSGRR